MGSRSKSAKTNKHEKEEPERKADADEYFLSFQTIYISNRSAKTDNGLIAIVLLISYSLCFFPKGTLANFAQ